MYFYLIEFPIDVILILMLMCYFIYVHGSGCLFSCCYDVLVVDMGDIDFNIGYSSIIYIPVIYIYYYPYYINNNRSKKYNHGLFV